MQGTEAETRQPFLDGGCLCGRIRFTVFGEPLRVGLCHCSDCRRVSGSAYNYFATWRKSAFEGRGEFETFRRRSFCPTCGSRMFVVGEDEVEIALGALDKAPGELVPDYELWTRRRESWLLPLPRTGQHDKDRPPTP